MKLTIKSSIVFLAALSMVGVGCLKDKPYDNGDIQSNRATGAVPKVVEIKLTASNATNRKVFAFGVMNRDTTFNIVPVNLATAETASEDINVTLQIDKSIIDNLNHMNDSINNATGSSLVTDYAIPTPSMYTIINPGLVVTIPKGQNTGYLQLKLNPTNYISGHWAFGFSIKSVDKSAYTISGNLANGTSIILIKNKYDGLYQLTLNTMGWAAYGISDGVSRTWPTNASIITTGEKSVSLATNEGGDLQPAFDAGGGVTAFGATQVQFTFDLNTNAITDIRNLVPDDGRGRAFVPNPAVADNRYDPATKTIYAAYLMKQNGRPDQKIFDTLVYKASR